MNLKIVLLAGLSSSTILFLTGCNQASGTQSIEEPVAVPQFSASKGLVLPEQTRKSIGLKVAEVTEQKVNATVDLVLRVYQRNSSAAAAQSLVSPEIARRLRPGQLVHVNIPEGASVRGKVTRMNDSVATATGLAEVLVECADLPGSIAVGDFLNAAAVVESAENVMTIPATALLKCSEGQFVYAVNGEHFLRTPVKTGVTEGEWVEITDGLYTGDEVVSEPVLSLWLTELAAVKGGQACCVHPPKGK